MDVKLTKPKQVTYMGRRAMVWEMRKNTNRLGERVAFTAWLDDASEENGSHPAGTVTARHMTGDGRFPAEFSLFAHVLFDGPTAAQDAEAWGRDRIESGAASTPESVRHADENAIASIAARARSQFHRSIPVRIDCTPPSGC